MVNGLSFKSGCRSRRARSSSRLGRPPARTQANGHGPGSVSDRSQVEPLPPPAEPVPLDPPITEPDGDALASTVPKLATLVNELDCTLLFEEHQTDLGGFFAPATKVISINNTHSVNHQVKTPVHELAHALIHLTDRDGPDLNYAEEELVVESTIFSPCQVQPREFVWA